MRAAVLGAAELAGAACGVLVRERVAIAAFLVGAAYWPGIFQAATMPRWWAIAVAVPLAFPLDVRLLAAPFAACLGIGLAWAAASVADLPNPIASGAALEFSCLALLAMTAVGAAGVDLERALEGLACGVGTSCALAVPQALGWTTTLIGQVGAPAGTFQNPEVLALAAAPLFAWAALRGSRALACLLSLPLVLCGSRVALLAAAAGLLWGFPAPRGRKLALAAALAALAGLLAVGIGPGKFGSAGDRLVLWAEAAGAVVPLGRGLGWWGAVHEGPIDAFAHSDALQLLVELGLGGLFFLALPVMVLARPVGRRPERAALAAIVVECAVSFPLHLPATGFLAALLAGGLSRRRNPVRVAEPEGRADAGELVRWAGAPGVGLGRRGLPRDARLPDRPAGPPGGGADHPPGRGALT